MKLSVIIVSYNTKALLKKCLESIFASTMSKDDYEIIVVDNASTDDSLAMVKKDFPQVKLTQHRTNLGFARANNQATKKATGEYIFLLNSDAEVKKDTLNSLIAFMDSHPQAGIASAQLLNPDGTTQQSGGFVPRLSNILAWMFFLDDVPIIKQLFWSYHKTDTNFYQKTRQLGWVQGAAMVLRKSALNDIGLFDEKIFMYGEDIDLCLRARKSGWQVWSVAAAQAVHHRFQSGGEEKAILGEITGLKYIFSKHKPAWEQPLLRFILTFGLLLRAMLFATILRDASRYAIYNKALRLA